MAETQWRVVINMKSANGDWDVTLQSDESGMLAMLRGFYSMFENHMKSMAQQSAGERPAGLLDDAFVLLRCLVLGRLAPHDGDFVKIVRVRG